LSAFLTLMKGFLFLTRVGFILNLVFIVCLILRAVPSVYELFPQLIVGTLVVAGMLLSFLINMILSAWWVVLLQMKQQPVLLKYIILFNHVVLVFQLLFYFLI
jgi:hypothetical protein